MRRQLELQADRIETTLSLHNIPARVTGGTVTPRWVRFQVLPAVGVRLSRMIGLDEEIAAALDVESCRLARRGAAVAVEIPRGDPMPVRLMPLYRQLAESEQLPERTALLGLAEDGCPLLMRLSSPDVAHVLVAGTTGSGKTVLLQTMVLSLAMLNDPADVGLILVDPKGAFDQVADLPHVRRAPVTDMQAVGELFASLVRLMERRRTGTLDGPMVVVVIDELADLLMVADGEVQVALTRLTQRGRAAGIHVIAATQKPTTAVMGSLVKANFPVRLVGRVMSAEDARTAAGWAGSRAERLMGRGDFLAFAEGRVTRFQAAYISEDEIEQVVADVVAAWGRRGPGALPAGPVLVPVAIDEDELLARRLMAWDGWGNRHNGDGYAWGFLSEACRWLFDAPLVGNWYHRTREIVRRAETIATI